MGGGITRLRNNAFTLIELLAIIVILAIIAVITVPIILNIIENSRKGAATDSAYGYKDSVNKYYISELQNHNKLKLDGKYTVNSNGSLTPAEDNTFGFGDSEYGESLDVAVSGTIPFSGKLRYSNNVLNAGCVVIGDYKVTFGTDGKVDGTVKGDCSTYEFPSEQGSNTPATPTNPYLTTFDGNYVYRYYGVDHDNNEDEFGNYPQLWANSLDDKSDPIYVRKNTSSQLVEYCGEFSGGTVCFSPTLYDYECEEVETEENSGDWIWVCPTEGYVVSKKAEFESKGATCNDDFGTTNENGSVIGNLYCEAPTPDGYSNSCQLGPNGEYGNGCSYGGAAWCNQQYSDEGECGYQ